MNGIAGQKNDIVNFVNIIYSKYDSQEKLAPSLSCSISIFYFSRKGKIFNYIGRIELQFMIILPKNL